MAALSKIFAVATTYPYQVVRARLQDQHNRYNGVIDVIRRTWRYDSDLLHKRTVNMPSPVSVSKFLAVFIQSGSWLLFCHFLCRNEGATGFYKGIIPNLIRVTPACCITFVVYENVSRFLLGQNQWDSEGKHGQLQRLMGSHAQRYTEREIEKHQTEPELTTVHVDVLMWETFILHWKWMEKLPNWLNWLDSGLSFFQDKSWVVIEMWRGYHVSLIHQLKLWPWLSFPHCVVCVSLFFCFVLEGGIISGKRDKWNISSYSSYVYIFCLLAAERDTGWNVRS